MAAKVGLFPDKIGLDSKNIDWSALTKNDPADEAYKAAYAFDQLGETISDANIHERKLGKTLLEFVNLPSNAPVRLTSHELDGICGACTFQVHCKESFIDAHDEYDETHLELFEAVLEFARTRDPKFDECSARNGAGDVMTTAKATRKVMAHFAIAKDEDDMSLLYDDAYNRVRQRNTSNSVGSDLAFSLMGTYYDKINHPVI